MIKEHYIDIAGHKVFYRSSDSSNHSGSLVLLHGRSFTSKDWIGIKAFDVFSANGYDVYAPDYPGFGNSRDNPEYKFSRDFKNSSRFVLDFSRKLGLHDFTLVGPSMGGGITLRTLVDYPDIVSSAVVIGASGVEQMKDDLPRINVPMLILWGEFDDIIKKEDGVLLKNLVKNSELKIVPGAKHAVYLDNPSFFFDEMKNFLERHKN
ncbi:MAG: alpha/beta hydrolase [Thermoplasmataceae archaeon]|jgi:pimeloyl-ACP methyl ester carboxylesterase